MTQNHLTAQIPLLVSVLASGAILALMGIILSQSLVTQFTLNQPPQIMNQQLDRK